MPQGMDPLREEGGRCVFVPAVMHKKKPWRLVAMAVSVGAGLEVDAVMV